MWEERACFGSHAAFRCSLQRWEKLHIAALKNCHYQCVLCCSLTEKFESTPSNMLCKSAKYQHVPVVIWLSDRVINPWFRKFMSACRGFSRPHPAFGGKPSATTMWGGPDRWHDIATETRTRPRRWNATQQHFHCHLFLCHTKQFYA